MSKYFIFWDVLDLIFIHHYKLCLNYVIPGNFSANNLCPNNLGMFNSLFRFCVPRGRAGRSDNPVAATTGLGTRPCHPLASSHRGGPRTSLWSPWTHPCNGWFSLRLKKKLRPHCSRSRIFPRISANIFDWSNYDPRMIVIQHALTRLHACNFANLNAPRAKFMCVLTQHKANQQHA